MVAQVQGVLPEGKPVPYDQVHAAMPTCLGHVEGTLVLVSGPGPGSSLPPRNASDGCIPDRLGGGHEWPPCPRSVEWSFCSNESVIQPVCVPSHGRLCCLWINLSFNFLTEKL